MIFRLEVLQARHGDSLLLHYGEQGAPRLIVIDGGPAGVYRRVLGPRLEQLRQQRAAGDALPIRLLMISHIDDDHIRGVVDLTDELREAQDDGAPRPYRVQTIWHNSFDDVVGANSAALLAAVTAELGGAAVSGDVAPHLSVTRPAAAVLASVPQGRALRDNARALGFEVNEPGRGPVTAGGGDGDRVEMGGGLELRVLGPSERRVRKLQREWDLELERRDLAADFAADMEAVAYLEESVYNLVSLVVLAEAEGRTMLLTGDARGDEILAGARAAGLLADGPLHVDLLKLPNHGSDRNVDTDFFRMITADHYVISGDGRHGNPQPATFEMLVAARGDAEYTIHLTYAPQALGHGYPVEELTATLHCARQAGRRFTLRTPAAGASSLSIDLLG